MDQFTSTQISIGALVLVFGGTMYSYVVLHGLDPLFRGIASRIIGVPLKLGYYGWTPDVGAFGQARLHHELLASMFYFAYLFTFLMLPWCILFLAAYLFLDTATLFT